MARREQIRARRNTGSGHPDADGGLQPLPRRPVADTNRAAQMLDRIRRVLSEGRPNR
jgi:hypothetical protein